MTRRHFTWFNVEDGRWIGEWNGFVPAARVPHTLVGDGRTLALNEWVQQTQRLITPAGSPYRMSEQVWDMDAWDDCPAGGAVCLDVTKHDWPVGDFVWAVFEGVDRLLDFREMRTFIQVTPSTGFLDATAESGRPVRSKPSKLVADISGTSLQPFARLLTGGQFVRRDGRIVFRPAPGARLPEAVVLTLTDGNPDVAFVGDLERDAVALG